MAIQRYLSGRNGRKLARQYLTLERRPDDSLVLRTMHPDGRPRWRGIFRFESTKVKPVQSLPGEGPDPEAETFLGTWEQTGKSATLRIRSKSGLLLSIAADADKSAWLGWACHHEGKLLAISRYHKHPRGIRDIGFFTSELTPDGLSSSSYNPDGSRRWSGSFVRRD